VSYLQAVVMPGLRQTERHMGRVAILMLLPVLAGGIGCAPAGSVDDVAGTIWELKDGCNAGYLAADHDAILSVVHDGFLGWPAHFAGITREYCQIEKLANLERIPRPHGFCVSCLPVNIAAASAGWCRAAALVPRG
jgi:hypothetical protein